ncbi:MAG: hypothetical protein Q9214_002155 [Letrouitia sp. 1 TL-2023]
MADSETNTAAVDNKGTQKGEKPTGDQVVQLLISCIRYSNGGKIDFGKVAEECDIVSKGAAAKRYERLMKAHGIHPSSLLADPVSKGGAAYSNSRPVGSSPAPKAKPTVAKKAAVPKKRKASESDAEDQGSNEEPKAAPQKRARKQPVKKSARKVNVKTENEAEEGIEGYDSDFDSTDPLNNPHI